MANKVSELKAALGAGARPNKYRVYIGMPSAIGGIDSHTVDTLCKAANFPSVTLGQIEVWNQGRKLVIPGDTSYTNTWTLTFYQTEGHQIRRQMIDWMRKIDHWQNNNHSGAPNDVMGTMKVVQLDSSDAETVTYQFHNVFVQEVGEVSLGDDQVDTPMEFDVTFSFTDWVVGEADLNYDTFNAAAENVISE